MISSNHLESKDKNFNNINSSVNFFNQEIFNILNSGVFKKIGEDKFGIVESHPYIKGHTIDLKNKKLPIVPGIILKGLIIDCLGLRNKVIEQGFEVIFKNMVKGEKGNFISLKKEDNDLIIQDKNGKDAVIFKILNENISIDIDFNIKDIERFKNKGNFIKNKNYLFQNGEFSFVDGVYWLGESNDKINIYDSFFGEYEIKKDLPIEFLDEIVAQHGSLAVGPILKSDKSFGDILTFKSSKTYYKRQKLVKGEKLYIFGKVVKIRKRDIAVVYVVKNTNDEVISVGEIKGKIFSKKLLKRFAK